MTVDWINFMPIQALIGGLLIGSSAGLLLVINGQIAGISGITSRLLEKVIPHKPSSNVAEAPVSLFSNWRILFLLGLLSAPLLYSLTFQLMGSPPTSSLPTNPASENVNLVYFGLLAGGSFLTGLGARLANGCTSGHGVCGLARLSKRSFVAVGCFVSSAIATFYVAHYLLHWI